jgi:enoyl-CoA hydratase
MLTMVPHMLPSYKALIDEGAALSLGDALALEIRRARLENDNIALESLQDRGKTVREHGRSQKH